MLNILPAINYKPTKICSIVFSSPERLLWKKWLCFFNASGNSQFFGYLLYVEQIENSYLVLWTKFSMRKRLFEWIDDQDYCLGCTVRSVGWQVWENLLHPTLCRQQLDLYLCVCLMYVGGSWSILVLLWLQPSLK